MLLMKWKGIDDADVVSSAEAAVRCPHLLIPFYEKKMSWAIKMSEKNKSTDIGENTEHTSEVTKNPTDTSSEAHENAEEMKANSETTPESS